MNGTKDQRRRWRRVANAIIQSYVHVQDGRFNLVFRGYGPPKNGNATLYFQGRPIIDGQDWNTAVVNRVAYLMANKPRGRTRKQRKRFAK